MSKSVRVSLRSYELGAGDRYLFCSDGLTDQLEEEQIAEALKQEVRPDALVKILLDIAHAPQARDNIAIVILDVHPTGATDWPSPTLRARPLQQRQPDHLDDDDEPELMIVEHEESDDDAEDGEGGGDTVVTMMGDDDAELVLEDDDAEGIEQLDTSEFPAVKLVPEPSPEKAAAIKKVLLHDLPEPKDERDPTIRFRRSCRHCGADFDGPATSAHSAGKPSRAIRALVRLAVVVLMACGGSAPPPATPEPVEVSEAAPPTAEEPEIVVDASDVTLATGQGVEVSSRSKERWRPPTISIPRTIPSTTSTRCSRNRATSSWWRCRPRPSTHICRCGSPVEMTKGSRKTTTPSARTR